MSYKGNPLIFGPGVAKEYTLEQAMEWARCKEDPIYFIENYIKIVTLDHGLQLMKLYPFQKKIINSFYNSDKLIAACGRQLGKSSVMAAILCHYIIFNDAKVCAILAHKASTAREILDRVKKAYEFLPNWMKHGVVSWNKGSIELENLSKIMAAATSSGSIRGETINCVTSETLVTIIDDFDSVYYTTIKKAKQITDKMPRKINNKKFYTVYRTTNTINNKEYIGFHSTNDLDDGYLGSGKLIGKAIEKYGPESFKKEYIQIFDNQEDAEDLEKELVNEEYISREDTYNLVTGGNVCILRGEQNGFYGKHHSKETLLKIKESISKIPFYDNGLPVIIKGEYYRNRGFALRSNVITSFCDKNLLNGDFVYADKEKQEKELARALEKFKLSRETWSRLAKERFTDVPVKDEVKEKISNTLTGKPHHWQDKINKNPDKIRKTAENHRGRKRPLSTRQKQSERKKELIEKGILPTGKGCSYVYNPETKTNKRVFPGQPIPEGFVSKKPSNFKNSKTFYDPFTNKCIRIKEGNEPPEGYLPGMSKRNKS